MKCISFSEPANVCLGRLRRHVKQNHSFHSRNACLRMRWGGGRMKISALSHTRAVRLCVERRQIYFTEQLLWWTGNRGEKEQYKIKTCLLFWVGKFPISHNPALEWKTQKKIYPNVFIITELFWLTENTASYFHLKTSQFWMSCESKMQHMSEFVTSVRMLEPGGQCSWPGKPVKALRKKICCYKILKHTRARGWVNKESVFIVWIVTILYFKSCIETGQRIVTELKTLHKSTQRVHYVHRSQASNWDKCGV